VVARVPSPAQAISLKPGEQQLQHLWISRRGGGGVDERWGPLWSPASHHQPTRQTTTNIRHIWGQVAGDRWDQPEPDTFFHFTGGARHVDAHSHASGTSIRSMLLKPQTQKRTKGRLRPMFKNIIRLTLPLVVIMLIAMYLVLSPVLTSHAAAPQAPGNHAVVSHQNTMPNRFWRP
jgi:hypothetical protein